MVMFPGCIAIDHGRKKITHWMLTVFRMPKQLFDGDGSNLVPFLFGLYNSMLGW